MKENNELESTDIAIDNEMEVDCDIGQEITAYIETRFDVDRKFGTHIIDEPIQGEIQLIKDMIAEKIMQIQGQTPQDFCRELNDGMMMGGM